MTLTPDICVIGAGSAGLTVAAAAASFGLEVVLVERGRMGGDCLNYGCVPSKSLIAAARRARGGAALGVRVGTEVDFGAVHDHVHEVIATIAPHDSVERFEGLGVRVLQGEARFLDARTIAVGETTLTPRRTVIATGSRPVVPPFAGLDACDPLTNESVFDLTRLPRRLAIIGAGPIGAELSQAFARLGSEVTVASTGTLLPREDPEAVAVVRRHLLADGVRLVENTAVTRATPTGEGGVTLTLADGAEVTADRVLVATGRTPNIEALGLEAAGIAFTDRGVTVDDRLRTTNRRVFAIGDVTGGLQFTHVAGHQASLVVKAIVFRFKARYDPDLMPRATYTAPELAHVGLDEAAARARYGAVSVRKAPLSGNDRAQTEGETDGFVKLIIGPKSRLVGATIVAPAAGEMIATYQLALAAKVPLKTLASFTPAYPTFSEAGKRAAVTHFAEWLEKPWVRTIATLLRGLP